MSIPFPLFPVHRSRLLGAGRGRRLLLPALLILAACAGPAPKTHRPVARPPESRPVKPPDAPESVPAPAALEPAEAPPAEETGAGESAPVAAPPAVLALREDAAANVAGGDLDNAASTLERAIRLQPRNPELWHDLAAVRLKQQQPVLAEELAKKSNTHAKGNTALVQSNWALIAEARRLKGDAEGAADADAKAGR